MLSISWISNPDYYLDQSSADYYFAGGEPPGIWHSPGTPITTYGLPLFVDRVGLHLGFTGAIPDGRTVQIQSGKQHQAAWDLTFSAPKPVSILWSGASRRMRRAIERMHNRAVKKALNYLQKTAAYTRRGKGGVRLETVPLLFALFCHSVSRELDPQLHTHALLMNMALRGDGSLGTIVSKTVYEHKLAAGAVYQAALAQGLARLGFKILPERVGFSVEGVPDELCKQQSKRRRAIEHVLGSRDLNSAKASQVATLATRRAKRVPPRGELLDKWAQTNARYGLTAEVIDRLAARRGASKRTRNRRGLSAAHGSIVDNAITRLSERESHFALRDVYREALQDAIPRGLDPDALYKSLEVSAVESLVPVGRRDGYIHYTTKQNLGLEQTLFRNLDEINRHKAHTIDRESVQALLEARLPIGPSMNSADCARNVEQRLAVERLTLSSGGLGVLVGTAGTGKSFTLGLCNELWTQAGLTVQGLALSGAAARRLEEGSSIPSDTLDLFLTKLEHSVECKNPLTGATTFASRPSAHNPDGVSLLTRDHVIVLDEAAIVGTKKIAQLAEYLAKTGAQLVSAGDRRQLQSIEAGGFMKRVEERYGCATLSVVTRQREVKLDPHPTWMREAVPNPTWMREAVNHFANGNSVEGLLLHAERGRVSILVDREAAKIALVQDWALQSAAVPDQHLILAAQNADVDDLNDLCQLARQERGLLSREFVVVDGEKICAGDRILCVQRSRPLGLENGDLGTVESLDSTRRLLNVKFDSGKTLKVDVGEFPHLRRGYAITVFKSQGASVERTSVLLGGSGENLHQSYVELSRHRSDTRLYTTQFEAGQILEDLAIQMSQSRERDLALDVLDDRSKIDGPLSQAYYVSPKVDDSQTKLELQKLERLRDLFVTPIAPQVKPPHKTDVEIQALLERLRAGTGCTALEQKLPAPHAVQVDQAALGDALQPRVSPQPAVGPEGSSLKGPGLNVERGEAVELSSTEVAAQIDALCDVLRRNVESVEISNPKQEADSLGPKLKIPDLRL